LSIREREVEVAKLVQRTFSTRTYREREAFLYVNIMQEDQRVINIDGDKSKLLEPKEQEDQEEEKNDASR